MGCIINNKKNKTFIYFTNDLLKRVNRRKQNKSYYAIFS